MKSWVVLRRLGCWCHDPSCSENICHEMSCLCKRAHLFLSRSISVVLALFLAMKPFCATLLLVALHWQVIPSCAHRQLPFSDAVPSDTSVQRDQARPRHGTRSTAHSPISRSQARSPSRTSRTSAASKMPLPRLILHYSECPSTPRSLIDQVPALDPREFASVAVVLSRVILRGPFPGDSILISRASKSLIAGM